MKNALWLLMIIGVLTVAVPVGLVISLIAAIVVALVFLALGLWWLVTLLADLREPKARGGF